MVDSKDNVCTAFKGGYSLSHCDALKSVAKPHSKSSTGILYASTIDIKSKKSTGTRVAVRPRRGDSLLVFNYCPFCQGELRDSSEDGNDTSS